MCIFYVGFCQAARTTRVFDLRSKPPKAQQQPMAQSHWQGRRVAWSTRLPALSVQSQVATSPTCKARASEKICHSPPFPTASSAVLCARPLTLIRPMFPVCSIEAQEVAYNRLRLWRIRSASCKPSLQSCLAGAQTQKKRGKAALSLASAACILGAVGDGGKIQFPVMTSSLPPDPPSPHRAKIADRRWSLHCLSCLHHR